jgi:hypothetical protein
MLAELNSGVSQNAERHKVRSPCASDQFFGIGVEDPPPWPKRSNEHLVTLFDKFLELRN